MCYYPTPTLHLNLALTGDGAFLFSLKKTHSVWFISVLNYGDTENVLINHLLLVIPVSYPCHDTNLCPHKPHKHAHTHTHTHTDTAGPCRDLWRGRCSKYKGAHETRVFIGLCSLLICASKRMLDTAINAMTQVWKGNRKDHFKFKS